ncbi:MAG TPA: FkbM family methyltransferase [Flavisolibacter sp.]|jgi:FkbM family methyltransferase|nr:FkbM family methyltransferase [Flavisolibacter sp.]
MSLIKETGYKVLDLITLGRGVNVAFSGFKLRLPTRYHRYFPSDYEHDNFTFLKKHTKPGNIVIDVGAHFGLFAVRAAQLVGSSGTVYAFEPTPSTQKLLQKTILINNMQDCIVPQNEAIADKDGETFFYVSDNEGDNSNSLIGFKEDRRLHKVKVKLTSIDNFILSNKIHHVDFIKIDAEGFEYNVLLGCINVLKVMRPHGILSLHPLGIKANGNTLEEIYNFLESYKYDVIFEGGLITKDMFCSQADLFDVHFLPRQKLTSDN